VKAPLVEVRLQATYNAPDGQEYRTNASIMAVVEETPRLAALPGEYPDDFEPDEWQRIPITVTNNDLYPDMVSLRVEAPEGWLVSPPSSVRLDPGETKTLYVDVKAPDNPWFLYSTKSEFIGIDVVSENADQPLVTAGIPITQTGVTFPGWALPHLAMLVLGAGLFVKRVRRNRADRKLEKGKPSFPGLDPEHEAEFEALKIEDPEKAEAVEDRLQVLYGQRKEAWKEAYDERQDREEELGEVYQERHGVLVEARESEDRLDPEEIRERRELLQRKRALLERKRELLESRETTDEPAEGTSDATPEG
jgi:hypothetical protein